MKTIFRIDPDYETALRDAGLADFDSLLHARGGRPASLHAHRETVPLEIPISGEPRRFFLKRVFRVPMEHAVLPLLRLSRPYSQPMREWNMIRELRAAELPVMRCVAVGERRRLGLPVSALLLVEAAPMRQTLEQWLVPGFLGATPVAPRSRRRLFHALGSLLGSLQGEGFVWPDLHVKHIFAAMDGEGWRPEWRFLLIDVERMSRGRPRAVNDAVLSGLRALDEILRFRASASPLRLSAMDCRSFAAGYSVAPIRKIAGLLDVRPLLCGDDASPRLPDDYVHPGAMETAPRGDISVAADSAAALDRAGLCNLDSIFAWRSVENLHKPGLHPYRDRARIRIDHPAGSTTYYVKRYLRPPLAEQIRRWFEGRPRRSTAWRERHFAKRLAAIGIATIRVVAFGEEMRGRWERRSALITAEVPGESLERLAQRALRDPTSRPPPGRKREIISQLAAAIRIMHRHQIYHRDLYLSHIFVSPNSAGRPVVYLIDLARMLERPMWGDRWRIKDLAALEYSSPPKLITRADRIRFLRHYAGRAARPADREEWKLRIRYDISRILARSRRMARHDARRRRGAATT